MNFNTKRNPATLVNDVYLKKKSCNPDQLQLLVPPKYFIRNIHFSC